MIQKQVVKEATQQKNEKGDVDRILELDQLPVKYVAYSGCFRREAGSYGKDTRGFFRVHQLNKVELVNFVRPEISYDIHEKMLDEATKILRLLEIPYCVLSLAIGDLSFAAAKYYDIETWSPAEGKWLEASSVSNFEDFQPRRANIRFRREKGKSPEFVHTLNGSGLATSRLMVSLLETHQTGPFNPYSRAINGLGRIWSRSLLWSAGVKVKSEGMENIDPGVIKIVFDKPIETKDYGLDGKNELIAKTRNIIEKNIDKEINERLE